MGLVLAEVVVVSALEHVVACCRTGKGGSSLADIAGMA